MNGTNQTILWQGKTSQLINLPIFLFLGFLYFLWLFLPYTILYKIIIYPLRVKELFILFCGLAIILSIPPILKTLALRYELTNQRLLIFSGVLTRIRNEIELYRIKDYKIISPLYLRIFGYSNIMLFASDKSSPIVVLSAIKNSYKICDLLREQVENAKTKRGYLEID